MPQQALFAVLAFAGLGSPASMADRSEGDAMKCDGTLLHESFENLERWVPVTFRRVRERSNYEIRATPDGGRYLLMTSDGGASGLVLKESFDVREYPVVRWRWRVDEPIRGANHSQKDGDDYPVRVYVAFEYDAVGLSWTERLRYEAYRAFHGEYPPHSALNYVWTVNVDAGAAYPSPYSRRVIIRVLRGPDAPLEAWVEETIDIISEYRAQFNEDPPRRATLGIMTDSDDTGQSTRAAVDFIRIQQRPQRQNLFLESGSGDCGPGG